MARFPSYERQVGLSGGATAPFMSDSAMTAPAHALQGAGNALQNVGDQFAQVEAKIRDDQDNLWVSKARSETAIDMNNTEREAQMSATDGAQGYTQAITGTYEDYRKNKIAQAPSAAAAHKYQIWSDGYNVDLTKRSAGFQADSELSKRTSDLSTTLANHEKLVYSDPTQYDKVKARAEADLKAASAWLTPEQETAVRTKFDHDLELARAKGKVDTDPAGFKAEMSGGPAAWRGAIASIESAGSGGYAAVGPRDPNLGRALGRYQIMEANIGPWSQEALGHSVTVDQFLGNPKIQDAIFDYKFGGYVKKYGLEGAAQAWFGGEGSVGKINRKDVLGTDVGSYGKRFMAALGENKGVVTDGRYAGLSIDELRSLSNQADTSIHAAQTTQYASMKDSLEQGIATGSVINEGEIINSGLNGGDVATLLGKLRTAQKEKRGVAETLAALGTDSFTGDPFDGDTRKNIDGASLAIKEKATPQQYQAATENIVQQSGIVPKDVLNEIRRGLQSTNPADVAAAAQRGQRISTIDGSALGRREGGAEVQRQVDDFNHYIKDLNLSPEDAARRIIDSNDPEKKRTRQAMEPAAKEFLKGLQDFDLAAQFDDSVMGWRSNPSLGMTPGQALGIKADFLAIAEDEFYRSNGDPDLAQNRAVERMKRLYGVTSFGGANAVVKHPPEKFWPVSSYESGDDSSTILPLAPELGGEAIIIPEKGAPSLDYAKKQLTADVTALDPNADLSTIQLVTTPETDAMVKRGEMPAYSVIYKDSDGVYQTIPGKLWKPDFKGAVTENAKEESDAKAEQLSKARKSQEKQRGFIENFEKMRREGMQNNPLIDNPKPTSQQATELPKVTTPVESAQ